MKLSVLALAGLLALPATAAAQEPVPPEQLPTARFAITPFVGLRVPYSTSNTFIFTENNGIFALEEDRGGGVVAGAELEAHISGPVSLLGSLAYGNSGQQDITLTSEGGDVIALIGDTPEMWMAKLAVSYRLPEPRPDNRRFHPAGMLFAGPALVRTHWSDGDLDDEFDDDLDDITHWGVNFGVHTAVRVGKSQRVALHFGVEDYLTFWNNDQLTQRNEILFGRFFEDETVVDIDSTNSNIVLLRAGLSFRFR